jgi:threonine/homoserine/homoserine lactone efflux protein
MEASAVLGFALIALTLVVVPGPDWAYVLAVGARDHVVAQAVGGLLLGYAAITAVVVAGIGPLVAGSSLALTVLTLCGAAYLVQLGMRVLRSPVHLGFGDPQARGARRPMHYLMRGAGTSALNPKGLLLFLSILPQFTRPAAGWPVPLQLAALGGIFMAACACVYLPLGYASDRVLGARPGAARVTTKVAGAAMVIVGLVLLGERLVATVG